MNGDTLVNEKDIEKSYEAEKICIKEFFYGNGCFSYGATQDIIFSMLNGKSKSMSFVKGEEVVPCKIPFGSSITIEPNIGPVYPYPIISEDFYEVCKGKVQEAYFFNTFSDINSVSSFFEIGSQIFYENRECAYNYTEKLKQLYDKEGVGIERTEFVFFVEKKNEAVNKRIVFEYLCNWNTLSGYICALVAEQCLKNTLSKICVCKFSEIDATKNLVNNLPGKIEIKE